MEKLELKHIAPYLPYGLNGFLIEHKTNCFIIGASEDYVYTDAFFDEVYYTEIKPVLRPLNELIDYFQILWNKKDEEVIKFMDLDFLERFNELDIDHIKYSEVNYLPVGLYNLLLKHHFDLFRLINKGLALKKD